MYRYTFFPIVIFLILGCQNNKGPSLTDMKINISKDVFGQKDGQDIFLYTLENDQNMSVSITNYGGIITKIKTPDRDGKIADVVLGFNNLNDYLGEHPFFGAIIGRYGNRIANGKFSIDDQEYTLPINNEPNSLHGGLKGFDKKVWLAKEINDGSLGGIELSTTSRDGEEGYPGKLDITVKYLLSVENELHIEYAATTDKPTVINLTNHSYFNLKGEGSGDVMQHQLMIKASKMTPVNSSLIPSGMLDNVKGTPFDFTSLTPIGERIDEENLQLSHGGGYDHNFVFDDASGKLKEVAMVYEPITGRKLQVFTTEPGVQLYTGNFLDGTLIGKSGRPYQKRHAFCLETQHFPDSPNHAHFPSTRLNPNEVYQSKTVYKFSNE